MALDESSSRERSEAFQARVAPWMDATFGARISGDKDERAHRFLEEALELVQSTGTTVSEAHQLVDYVFGRPVGETHQEVGGVMVTLAALCLAHSLNMHQAGETELARCWTKVEQIRAKQAGKPKHSPLPEQADAVRDVLAERRRQVEKEGWSPEHDDGHDNGEMALAAGSYATKAHGDPTRNLLMLPSFWPFEPKAWKPTSPRRMLVKAGALILAEIERLDRAAARRDGGSA